MTNKLREVRAWEAWEIFADYDANAPTTQGLLLVGTEELAKEIVDLFNVDPRMVGLAYVDGWEHCKKYDYCVVFISEEETANVIFDKARALEGTCFDDDDPVGTT